MIDLSKEYTTRNGKPVTIYNVVPYAAGKQVTFPIKGCILISKNPHRTKYQIWTEDGRASIFGPENDDLIEKEV